MHTRMGSQAGSASVFVRKAADALQAALALEGSGDDDGAFALYQDAIRDLTCAAAFETRGAAFTEAQRGSIAVIKSRRAQLERRLQAGTRVAARDTVQHVSRADHPQPSLAPEISAPQGSKPTQGPAHPASDTSLDAPILGHEKIKSLLREAIILPQLLPQVFHGLRTPLRTLLLHGPPGTVNAVTYCHQLVSLGEIPRDLCVAARRARRCLRDP